MQIPDELEARLVNWGRWTQGGKPTYRSWLAKFQTPDPDAPKEQPPKPVDELDAQLVNKVWQMMPGEHYDDRRAKILIGAMYASRSNVNATLASVKRIHRMNIRPGEVDRLMGVALRYIARHLGYNVLY